MCSSRFLAPQRRQRDAQFSDRAKHAVLGCTGSESERRADFVDRASFVVPQRERRAFERAQRLAAPSARGDRFPRCAPAVRVPPVRPPAAPRRSSRLSPRTCRGAPVSIASDPPSSWRRCDRARCRNSRATRSVRAGDTREGSFPGPHLRHPAHFPSSGRPAGTHSGCAARRARETPRRRPGGHGPGRLMLRSRPSAQIRRWGGRPG